MRAANAIGQRTRKVTQSEGKVTPQGGTTVYHYDLLGNLIAETRADGGLMRAVDNRPLVQIDATGTTDVLLYLHTDHLNTPRLATNTESAIVWRWEGRAFGNTAADQDPDGDGTNVNVRLRFPGQYYDQESGLYYNWNRYYDPGTGRYITSDPIGLVVDLNTYVYVKNDPLRYIDPLGLFSIGGAIEELKNDTAFIVDESGAFVGIQSFRQMTLCRRRALDQCSIQCGREVLGIEALSQLLFPIGEKISEEVRNKAMKKTISSLLKALDRLSTIGSMVELASCSDKCSRDPDVIEEQRQCTRQASVCPVK